MLLTKKKRTRLTLPARASVWYTVTGALERGITFVFTPIFTRMLTAEEFGIYPLYISWMGLFTVFITLELTGNAIYRGIARFKGEEDKFVSCALGLISLSALLFLALIIIFSDFFIGLTGLPLDLLVILLLQIYFSGIMNLYFARCRYFYKYKLTSLLNIVHAAFVPTLSFVLINFTRLGGVGRIIAPMIVSFLMAAPIGAIIVKRGRAAFSAKIWKYLLKFSLPLLPHFIATTIMSQAGKIVVGRYFGEGELAKYSVVFSMGFVFSLVTGGINSALSPWINRKLERGEGGKIGITAEKVFAVLGILTLMGLCYSPEGLAFLAPIEYQGALGAIYPISISVLFTFLVLLINAIILYYGRNYLVTGTSVIAAAINLLLNFTLTARYGYIAAAFVQSASSLVLLVLSYLNLRGVLKKQRFSAVKYLRVILVCSTFAAVLFTVRDVFISRVLIFAALILMLIPRALECRELIKEKPREKEGTAL